MAEKEKELKDLEEPKPGTNLHRMADWDGSGLIFYDKDGNWEGVKDPRLQGRYELSQLFKEQYYVEPRDEWFLDRSMEIMQMPLDEFTEEFEDRALTEFYERADEAWVKAQEKAKRGKK